LRSVLIACLLLLVAGCTMRPQQPDAAIDWDRRAALLAAQANWQVNGRIAVKADGQGGQGNIVWIQRAEESLIKLRGPFGAGAYEIVWNDERIVITGGGGEKTASYTGPDAAERFIEQQLGWTFPARSIRYWLLGIADPAYASERRLDAAGWLEAIEQNGWTVEFSRFETSGGYYLPGKLVAQNATARVKLIVDEWSLAEVPPSPGN
jgi:outer membrane lipoprotein LolB